MPIIGVPLKLGDTGTSVQALQDQLMTLGFTIDGNELPARRFGAKTLAAVLAVRKRHGLPEVANNTTPFDASVDRLLHVAAARVTGNTRMLRDAVRESFAAAQNPPETEIVALARYATIARDFATARQAAALAPRNTVITQEVGPIVCPSTFRPAQPEIQTPENYYTCRYDYIPPGVLDALLGRTAGLPGPRARMRRFRRMPTPCDDGDWSAVLGTVPAPEPPPPQPSSDPRKAEIKDAAISWLHAVGLWQRGNRAYTRQRYAPAVTAYKECQDAVIRYFVTFYKIPPMLGHMNLSTIIGRFVTLQNIYPKLWELINRRRDTLSLRELQILDWSGFSFEAEQLIRKNLDTTTVHPEDNATEAVTRQQSLDYVALLLAAIFVPLARAEAHRLRHCTTSASEDLQHVLTPYRVRLGNLQQTDIWLTCDFIEQPFARLLLGETPLSNAASECKSEAQAGADAPQGVFNT
jgi:peptidoglycan hydrolase-like protein with peptidoglycan-binding domain